MTLLSEIGKDIVWNKPEKMLVVKKSNIDYASYWNNEKGEWSGLLNATIYTDETSISNINGEYEVIDYKKITNTK